MCDTHKAKRRRSLGHGGTELCCGRLGGRGGSEADKVVPAWGAASGIGRGVRLAGYVVHAAALAVGLGSR